jgi:hypothetical protein
MPAPGPRDCQVSQCRGRPLRLTRSGENVMYASEVAGLRDLLPFDGG